MKKVLFVVAALVVLGFVSCSKESTTVNSLPPVSEFVDFKMVAKDGSDSVLVDTKTGVLYYQHRAGYQGYMTVLLNEDGTPKTLNR